MAPVASWLIAMFSAESPMEMNSHSTSCQPGEGRHLAEASVAEDDDALGGGFSEAVGSSQRERAVPIDASGAGGEALDGGAQLLAVVAIRHDDFRQDAHANEQDAIASAHRVDDIQGLPFRLVETRAANHIARVHAG